MKPVCETSTSFPLHLLVPSSFPHPHFQPPREEAGSGLSSLCCSHSPLVFLSHWIFRFLKTGHWPVFTVVCSGTEQVLGKHLLDRCAAPKTSRKPHSRSLCRGEADAGRVGDFPAVRGERGAVGLHSGFSLWGLLSLCPSWLWWESRDRHG